MNDQQIGRTLRALRRRLTLRQADVARRSGVSQQRISDIERGHASSTSAVTLRRVFAAVDAEVVLTVRWRGGALDRLLDEGHADIVGRAAAMLRSHGWQVLTEATFAEHGERGSVDLLAWHPATRTVLVVEVKTEIASAEELLRAHDTKVRLAPKLAADRFNARARSVGRLLVVAESATNRRRLARLEPLFAGASPMRGGDVRCWIRDPDGPFGGVLFVRGRADREVTSRARVRARAA